MASIKGYLIDLDGVVYQQGALIPGSREALARLDATGTPYRFITNTTSKPLAGLIATLAELGLHYGRDRFLTPALAARAYLERHGLDPYLLIHPVLAEDFARLPPPAAGARRAVVLADARDDLSYANLNRAFRLLDQGAELISLAGNRYFLDGDGERSLDVGAFAALLEFASGRRPIVLGKPSADYFHAGVAALGLQPAEVAMIGDDAEFDVSAAIAAGLAGFLVRTGKYAPGDEDKVRPAPTGTYSDFAGVIAATLRGAKLPG